MESVIIVDAPEMTARLRQEYPAARQWLWNRAEDSDPAPALLPLLDDTVIIKGDFSQKALVPLARAM